MNKSKLCNLIGIVILCLIAIPLQSQAANPNTKQSDKERLVLMPLRVDDEDKNLLGAMETALVEGLKLKYEVFSGERVAQKAHEIFMKESRNTAHTECDETRCMQNIAEAFQAELIATANVTKQGGGYFLALSIQNIFDNKVEFSKTLTCEGCNAFKVVEKLKELSGNSSNAEASEAAMAAERKAKAEELKQEQLAFEEKLRNADAAERKRLLDAKAEDDKHLAELKAQAEAKRKSSATQAPSDFPTVESAITEINRLKENIKTIEAGYETELGQTRQKVSQRYATQLSAVDKTQRDEFETTDEFKAKQDQKRSELNHQRDAELARLNSATLAATEISPLQDKIKSLSEREYTVSTEMLVVNLGAYAADEHYFPVSITSKVPSIRWEMSGTIPLPIADAKVFKQQWVAGLVRAEMKIKPTGETSQVTLVNDADNSRLNSYAGKFMTSKARDNEVTTAEAEALTGVMIHIPGKNYKMGKYDVTRGEFAKFVNETRYDAGNSCYVFTTSGWKNLNGSNWRNPGFSQDDTHPVTCVSWIDAQAYLTWLSKKTGKQFRLPTEEEWEYACYGGSQTEYCGGNNLDSVAWYEGNSSITTHPVGQKQANGYGLYDMSGNVWQWMDNCYDNGCNGRAIRGGDWSNNSDFLRVAHRLNVDPTSRYYYFGFRLVTSTTQSQSDLPKWHFVSQGGLIWMPILFNKNWSDANDYCNNTAINWQSGWRLPTKSELSALYNAGAMNDQGWAVGDTWSSAPVSTGLHYGVSLRNGTVYEVDDTTGDYVTCVR